MVLYRGYPAWRSHTEVFDLIQPAPPEIAPYQPHLKFLLLDVNVYPPAELEAMSNPVACIFRLERSPTLGTAASRGGRKAGAREAADRAQDIDGLRLFLVVSRECRFLRLDADLLCGLGLSRRKAAVLVSALELSRHLVRDELPRRLLLDDPEAVARYVAAFHIS